MKTKYTPQIRSGGFALLLVLVMCAISLVIMVAIMNRTATVSKLNNRYNLYMQSCVVAQAATEKVYDQMAWDFRSASIAMVTNSYSSGRYRTNIPTVGENSYWGNFVFFDPSSGSDSLTASNGVVYITFLTNYAGAMPSQYTNLYTKLAPIYRIVANASPVGYPDIVGTAQEDILFALLPIDTYAIFYNGQLEFTSCATMVVNGRTHANGPIDLGTSSSLTFNGMVTSASTIGYPSMNGQTITSGEGTTLNAGYATNVTPVLVGLSMTNSHTIIELPLPGEIPNSPQGQIRECNQAQVLLLVTNLPVSGQPPTPQVTFILQSVPGQPIQANDIAKTTYTYIWTNYVWSNTVSHTLTNNGIFTNMNLNIWTNEPHCTNCCVNNAQVLPFLTVTNTFTDKREYQTNMFVTQIDVGAYTQWLFTNGFQTSKLWSSNYYSGSANDILYVADQRNVGTNKLSVVRLVNCATLPTNTPSSGTQPLGFSIATLNPLYVKGYYNVTLDGTHFAYTPGSTTNTPSCTVPSALLSDAITILTTNFNDSASKTNIGTAAMASSTNTVNAAIITGNVPSTGTSGTTFSGGVHNLMRMQENWTGVSLTLNTSICCLWASQMATNQFRNPTGFSPSPINPYYSPPTRLWGFDPNFANPAKQPAGVPTALVPIRFNWTVPPPGTINYNVNNVW